MIAMLNSIPFDNLGYPVLLSLNQGQSFGSGFRLKYKGLNLIVTAKHVLFDNNDNLRCTSLTITCQSIHTKELENVIFEIDLTQAKCFASNSSDIAIILIGRNIPIYKNPKSAEQAKKAILVAETNIITQITPNKNVHLVSADVVATRTLDKVGVGNSVYIIGYPASLGIKNQPQIDYTKPLLRKGIIAGINYSTKTIVLDCPVYFGNSGGPVIEYCEDYLYRVIGVVSQYVPFVTEWVNLREQYSNSERSNSGYSIITPMDCVFELIDAKFSTEINQGYDEIYKEYKEIIDPYLKNK